jgi:hypothetical protein
MLNPDPTLSSVQRMPDHGQQKDRLEHARWRVSFAQSLLDTHRSLPFRAGTWGEKEAELSGSLASAQAELERLASDERKHA